MPACAQVHAGTVLTHLTSICLLSCAHSWLYFSLDEMTCLIDCRQELGVWPTVPQRSSSWAASSSSNCSCCSPCPSKHSTAAAAACCQTPLKCCSSYVRRLLQEASLPACRQQPAASTRPLLRSFSNWVSDDPANRDEFQPCSGCVSWHNYIVTVILQGVAIWQKYISSCR